MNTLCCSVCTKKMKSAVIYECDHVFCELCNKNRTKCSLCDDEQENLQFITEAPSENEELEFEWSNHKNSKQSPQKMSYQSQTKKKVQYLNPLSNSYKEDFMLNPSNLICKKHQQPLTFFQILSKNLLCPSCLYYQANKKSYSSISNNNNSLHLNNHVNIIPLKNAMDILKTEIKNNLEDFKQFYTKIDQSLKLCRHSKTIIQTNYNSILEQVTSVCDSMIRQIRSKEKQLKSKIVGFLNNKALYYQNEENELSKFKDFIKEIKSSTFNFNRKAEKPEEIATLYQISKELKKSLLQLKFDQKPFGLSELNLLKYNKKLFEAHLENTLKLFEENPPKTNNRKMHESVSVQKIQKITNKQSKSHLKHSSVVQKQVKRVSYLNLLKQKKK